jgi:hypothetical protein
MRPSQPSILLAASIVALGATQAASQQECKPRLSVEQVRFSEVENQHRKWSALIAVDAARCTASSGRFDITFVRLKETAPDLSFTERFTWTPGKVEVAVQFWADEAAADYTISHIAPCACRN